MPQREIKGQSGAAMVHSNIGNLARAEFLKTWPFMAGKTLDEIYAFGRTAPRLNSAPLMAAPQAASEATRLGAAVSGAAVPSIPVGNHGDNNL